VERKATELFFNDRTRKKLARALTVATLGLSGRNPIWFRWIPLAPVAEVLEETRSIPETWAPHELLAKPSAPRHDAVVFRNFRRYIRGFPWSAASLVGPGVSPGDFFEYPALAHVTYVVGCVHLNLEPIRIVELEGFFRSKVREFQTTFP
jgi:hypothetical protein